MIQETIFACDELAELQQHNALLKVQNKELLARCDLLEAELAGLKELHDVALIEMEKALQQLQALQEMNQSDEWGPYAKAKAHTHVLWMVEQRARKEAEALHSALVEAVRPVARSWALVSIGNHNSTALLKRGNDAAIIASEQLDTLAALAGEG